ncbi:MAG: branched-chain amino acid ABC transporter permease [Candidatus Dormibacteraceae bacterium]
MSLDTFAGVLISGLSGAAILFLVGAGLTLVFGALRLINMAHGSLYMIGAFVAVSLMAALTGLVGFGLAIAISSAAVGVVAGLIEIAILRRLYARDHLMQLVATFALIFIIDGVVQAIFGANFRQVTAPPLLTGSVAIGTTTVLVYQLFLISVAVLVAVGLWGVLRLTGLGRDIRAAVADPELLRLAGVNVPVLFTTVFCMGGLLAGLGGALIAPYHAVSLGIDVDIVVEAFAVTIIGGLGSLYGALIGAVLVGLVESFGIYSAPKFSLAFIFIVMAVVLVVRPWGLFGQPER